MTRVLALILAFATGAAALAGILVLSGHSGWFTGRALVARVDVADFPLPEDFGLEPLGFSAYLSQTLQDGARGDVALRVTLGADAVVDLIEIGVPRLVNSGMVRRMTEDYPPLADLLAVSRIAASATIEVRNDTGVDLQDVALTLPGALRVMPQGDASSGDLVPTQAGTMALQLGALPAGAQWRGAVWLDRNFASTAPADQSGVLTDPGWLSLQQGIAVGAAGGLRGTVLLSGDPAWPGQLLEAIPPVRWIVTALLFLQFAAAVVLAFFALRPGPRARRGAVSRA